MRKTLLALVLAFGAFSVASTASHAGYDYDTYSYSSYDDSSYGDSSYGYSGYSGYSDYSSY